VNEKIKTMLDKSGFSDKIGKENICSNINEALDRVGELVQKIKHPL
jgi:SulP family sulfate permease